MTIDDVGTPGLVRYIHTTFGEDWFGCSRIDKPEHKRLLLKLCDPRNGSGKEFFLMKDGNSKNRLYRLKRSAITKFVGG